jgi:hypothetical protein
MNGRVYDPLLGRFLSVDPLIGDPTDSQSVNPYAYVGNRPLSATDPSGYCEATCVNVIRIVVATALNFAFGGSGGGPPPAFVLPGQSAQYGGGVCEPGNTTLSCNGSILYAGAPNTAADNVQSSTPFDRIGVPIDIIFEGKAYTVTREIVGSAVSWKTGEVQTKLVVRPNCSPSVDVEYKPFCDAVYPSYAIESAILIAAGGYGLARGALALGGDSAVASGVSSIAEREGATLADQLASAATRARNAVGPGKGGAYGTRVHSAFEKEVNAMGHADLQTEVSYLRGQVRVRGTKGSVRLDVVNGKPGSPNAVYDLKTGSATLDASRIEQIQSHLPGGTKIPVYEVRPEP